MDWFTDKLANKKASAPPADQADLLPEIPENCKLLPVMNSLVVSDANQTNIVNPAHKVSCPGSTLQKIDDIVGPATVKILNVRQNSSNTVAFGSGFFTSSDTIVTNAHVVANTKFLVVQTPSGENFSARLQKLDDINDLAVLKVDGLNKDPNRGLVIGDDKRLQPNDPIAAVGHPGGQRANIISEGHVIVPTSYFNALSDRSQSTMAQAFHKFIQARPSQARDASESLASPRIAAVLPIWHGNSGGPVVNADHEVIGVAQAADPHIPGSGIMVPADKVREILSQPDRKFTFDYEKTSAFNENPVGTATRDLLKLGLTAKLPAYGAIYWGLSSASDLLPNLGKLTSDKLYGPRQPYALATGESALGIGGGLLAISSKLRPVGYTLMAAKVLWSVSHDFEKTDYKLKGYNRIDGKKHEPYGWTDNIEDHI